MALGKKQPESAKDGILVKLVRSIETHLIKYSIAGTITIISTAVLFYINTNNSLAAHTEQLIEIKASNVKIDSAVTNMRFNLKYRPELNKQEFETMKTMLEEIKEKQIKQDLRLDNIYTLMIEIASNNKNNK